jgi:hypothetical protein
MPRNFLTTRPRSLSMHTFRLTGRPRRLFGARSALRMHRRILRMHRIIVTTRARAFPRHRCSLPGRPRALFRAPLPLEPHVSALTAPTSVLFMQATALTDHRSGLSIQFRGFSLNIFGLSRRPPLLYPRPIPLFMHSRPFSGGDCGFPGCPVALSFTKDGLTGGFGRSQSVRRPMMATNVPTMKPDASADRRRERPPTAG